MGMPVAINHEGDMEAETMDLYRDLVAEVTDKRTTLEEKRTLVLELSESGLHDRLLKTYFFELSTMWQFAFTEMAANVVPSKPIVGLQIVAPATI